MERPRELRDDEVKQNPLLLELLDRARAGGESVITYHGVTVAISPVEDITATFTPEELDEFMQAYTEADNAANHLTFEQALALARERLARDE